MRYTGPIVSAQGRPSRVNLDEIRVVNTRSAKGTVVWQELLPEENVTAITRFHAPEQEGHPANQSKTPSASRPTGKTAVE